MSQKPLEDLLTVKANISSDRQLKQIFMAFKLLTQIKSWLIGRPTFLGKYHHR